MKKTDIKTIIRKEARKFLNESVPAYSNFETKLKGYDVHIYGFAESLGIERSIVDFESEFSVLWEFEIEARSWGIKSFITPVSSVRGTINWSIYKEDLSDDQIQNFRKFSKYENEELFEGVLEINSLNKFMGKEWKIDDKYFYVNSWNDFAPQDVEIDFSKMIIKVS